MEISDYLFQYLSCRPQPDDQESENCQEAYERADLRAVAPLLNLTELGKAFEGKETLTEKIIAYEQYISHEMQLRDYNQDGQIDRDEFELHQEHYLKTSEQWSTYQNPDTQSISRAEWDALGESRPWLRHDDIDEAFDILDLNRDETLTFEEIYPVVQQNRILWRNFK